MKILVDAMGGDNAPQSTVIGCIEALKLNKDINISLIGKKQKIEEILAKHDYDKSRLEIIHASEYIECEEVPTTAIKKKKDSSMVVGFHMLKQNKGDAFISAGNSGALMVGSLLILGRLKGVDRPALAAIIPTSTGKSLILDAGLNTAAKPSNIYQFAIMGIHYYKNMFNTENPSVGLINVGHEEGKGNETYKAAYEILKNSGLNFKGNIEAKQMFFQDCNVIVCDGFTGNILLKTLEGSAKFLMGKIKKVFLTNLKNKIAALVLKKDMNKLRSVVDTDENGGAPLLGVDGLVIKSHGNSTANTIKYVILKAAVLAEKGFQSEIAAAFQDMKELNDETEAAING